MKRILIVPLVLALVVLASISGILMSPGVAHADQPPGFDIEVQMLYCLNKDEPCNTPSTVQNSQYIQVETVSFHPGVTKGTPDAVDFTCGRAYFDANGVFHDVAEHVFAGYEGGTITGTAELEGNFTESSTNSVSEIENVQAFDPVTGDSGTARGMLVSNNVTDLRVKGGFKIELHGPIYDEFVNSSGKFVSTVVGNGEMECNTYGKYVAAPFASGPYFEGALGNTDND